MSEKIFCGVEGGASVSKLVLVNENGVVLCSLEGPASNYLLYGLEECQKRIVDMIERAKKKASLDSSLVLDALGLCMSGCEEDEANREFERNFSRKHPHIMRSCTVASDTIGPLYSASPKGGLVLIAGTGSNCLLLNPDGTIGRCGGWGHLLGDEASAMWISLRAVKTFFDDEDNLVKCPYDTSKVKELMLQHFKVNDKFGILEHCYVTFNKSSFAGLCALLAEAAREEKDPLCCNVFHEAGKMLAKMVVALRSKVHKISIWHGASNKNGYPQNGKFMQELLEMEGGLPIICVGSVFKSWSLLEKGFVEGLGNHYDKCTLKTLNSNCSSAIGAAYLGAKTKGFNLPIHYEENTSILFTFDSTKK